MNRTALRIVTVLALLVLGSVCLFGQAETGTLSGTVTDSSNAVVAGAKVTVVSTGTGLTRTATTGGSGDYAIASLKPDNYTLTVEHPAFQKYLARSRSTSVRRMDVSAQLGVTGASTTVEVTASGETAVVNTETQSLSQVVTAQQIADLPTLTRNPYDLVATAGNVAEDTQSTRGAGLPSTGSVRRTPISLLDGGENVDLFTATVGQSVPLDSVQEFRVVTSDFTAEYGRAGGGVVNVTTKSGTNQFHGSAVRVQPRLGAWQPTPIKTMPTDCESRASRATSSVSRSAARCEEQAVLLQRHRVDPRSQQRHQHTEHS